MQSSATAPQQKTLGTAPENAGGASQGYRAPSPNAGKSSFNKIFAATGETGKKSVEASPFANIVPPPLTQNGSLNTKSADVVSVRSRQNSYSNSAQPPVSPTIQ